jgi:hypothetical protein
MIGFPQVQRFCMFHLLIVGCIWQSGNADTAEQLWLMRGSGAGSFRSMSVDGSEAAPFKLRRTCPDQQISGCERSNWLRDM